MHHVQQDSSETTVLRNLPISHLRGLHLQAQSRWQSLPFPKMQWKRVSSESFWKAFVDRGVHLKPSMPVKWRKERREILHNEYASQPPSGKLPKKQILSSLWYSSLFSERIALTFEEFMQKSDDVLWQVQVGDESWRFRCAYLHGQCEEGNHHLKKPAN